MAGQANNDGSVQASSERTVYDLDSSLHVPTGLARVCRWFASLPSCVGAGGSFGCSQYPGGSSGDCRCSCGVASLGSGDAFSSDFVAVRRNSASYYRAYVFSAVVVGGRTDFGLLHSGSDVATTWTASSIASR
nr:hypothetical protein Iba_chr13dCG6410 [Ipomoea batatas]